MADRIIRFLLLALHTFLGVTAIFGAVWVVPLLPRQWLAGTAFSDYTIPAIALGAIGLAAFVSAGLRCGCNRSSSYMVCCSPASLCA